MIIEGLYIGLISIHALREEGDLCPVVLTQVSLEISIHALREEGDRTSSEESASGPKFLSTPSARRATCKLWGCGFSGHISIHALREEGD